MGFIDKNRIYTANLLPRHIKDDDDEDDGMASKDTIVPRQLGSRV